MLATESLIIVDHDQILAVFFYIVRVKGDPFLFLLYIFIYCLNMLNIISVFKKNEVRICIIIPYITFYWGSV